MDASSIGIGAFADVEGHAHVREIPRYRRCILQELRQGVRYQQEVITVRLHQGWHRMASISPRLAGEAPQERLQEEEVEHSALRTALPQAPVEPNARRWAVRGDNAHHRPAAKGVEEPDELLGDSHVAQEERQRPVRRCVKSF